MKVIQQIVKIISLFSIVLLFVEHWGSVVIAEEDNKDYVTIRSIGDILIHNTVYEDAYNGETYDFNYMFEPMKKYLENADITTANLEVIAAGDLTGPQNYPFFSAPSSIIDALKNVGVDLVINATNHTLDHGSSGAHASIDALKERDMMYVGSYESWDDYNNQRVIEVNGIKVGFLAYATDANGNYIPEDEGYLLSIIDSELIRLEVELIKTKADIAVVALHMGDENSLYPIDFQFEIANVARDAGANFILGAHPHVVEPAIYYSPNQGGIFSTGNFISGQIEFNQKIGGIIEYVFSKGRHTGDIKLERMRFMPTYNWGYPDTTKNLVVPLADAGQYGVDVEETFEQLNYRLRYYTNMIEVVEYLD